jgi:Na+/melibiose symporter-like transporter
MTFIPYNALIPELVKDYRARTTLVSWMQVGTYLGTTLGGGVRAYTSWRGDEVRGFQEFAVLSSVVMAVCYWIVVLCVKEPPLTPEQRASIARLRAERRNVLVTHVAGLFRALGYAFRNRYFLKLFSAVFTYQAGVLAGLWFYTFILEDWFGKTWNTPFAQRYMVGPLAPFRDGFLLYISVAVGCGTFMLPFWNWLGKYLEKRTCLIVGIVGVGFTYASSYWLFAGKSFPMLIVYALLQAFFYCPANIYPISMLADIATHDEWKNGEPNEGLFYGANSFLTKLYNAAGLWWFGFAQEYVVGYKSGASTQAPEVIERMRLLYAFPALAMSLVAVVFLIRYDLSRGRIEEINGDLQGRRVAAE